MKLIRIILYPLCLLSAGCTNMRLTAIRQISSHLQAAQYSQHDQKLNSIAATRSFTQIKEDISTEPPEHSVSALNFPSGFHSHSRKLIFKEKVDERIESAVHRFVPSLPSNKNVTSVNDIPLFIYLIIPVGLVVLMVIILTQLDVPLEWALFLAGIILAIAIILVVLQTAIE